MLKHIVLWKLKDTADGATKQENKLKVKAALESCAGKTPGMLKYEVGLDIGTDSGPWDVVLYSEFRDRAALEAYQQSPQHLAIKPVVGALREARAAVDCEV
jgi:quinol monooxygenase YgiN